MEWFKNTSSSRSNVKGPWVSDYKCQERQHFECIVWSFPNLTERNELPPAVVADFCNDQAVGKLRVGDKRRGRQGRQASSKPKRQRSEEKEEEIESETEEEGVSESEDEDEE